MLTCPRCGNEEPAGSQFCGSCGAPLAAAAERSDHPESTEAETSILRRCSECGTPAEAGAVFCGECGAALGLPPESSSVQPAAGEPEPGPVEPAAEEPAPVQPATPPPPRAKRPLGWIAAGAALAVLVAVGAATAAVLLRSGGGDGSTEAVTNGETLPTTTTTETLPPASSPTLADSIALPLQEVAAAQTAVTARVRALDAGVPESFVALQQAASVLVTSILGAQSSLDGVVPADSAEVETLALLRGALSSHLAYAQAVAYFPSRPELLRSVQAQAVIYQEEQTQTAYARLAAVEPSLSQVVLESSDHVRLLTLVPGVKPPQRAVARRVIDLVPLFVGVRPDDPPGEGRCFGQYGSASLTVSGVVYRSGFVQCGDGADGDPSRASGIYRFSGAVVPTATRARFTARVAIDESSSSSQRGSSVTWTVFYAGTPVCSTTLFWSGSRQAPRALDCSIPRTGPFDVRRLRIEQIASLTSGGDFWAGLLEPTVVVTST